MFTRCAPGMGTKPRYVRVERDDDIECGCGEYYPKRRYDLGYTSCLSCSTEAPKLANLPMHKQAYGFTNNPNLLRENCYGTHK